MKHRFGRTIVITLGGSIVYPHTKDGVGVNPDGIDTVFLRRFDRFLRRHLLAGRRFVLVVGGGRLARRFQEAAHRVGNIADDDKDWLGIHATRLNAHLVRTVFRDVADPVVVDARHRVKRVRYPVTVAAGWRPGWSTDYVAAVLAHDFGAREVIVAGKPAYVYPVRNRARAQARPKGASGRAISNGVNNKSLDISRPYASMSWRAYRKLIPKTWSPGLHAPMDPIAAKFAEGKGVTAIVVNGRDLKNIDRLLRGKDFEGTIIAPLRRIRR